MATKDVAVRNSSLLNAFNDFPVFSDWFEDFLPDRIRLLNGGMHPIKVEEFVKDGDIVVRAELPGIDPDRDINVHVGDGYLTISGQREESHKDAKLSEFYYGTFTRTIALPAGVDEKSVKADYKDGILEVHVKKPAAADLSTRVKIERK
ncbi:unannotated protein [freshwater metagenome]|uniref:Unannotated protein n=1 Tax=freshwater metagenome TaxID=449393 RepID=A0A6J7XUD4_9ZZZZ|nr:Hsp20 family protein [Actinomycetota bacterium]